MTHASGGIRGAFAGATSGVGFRGTSTVGRILAGLNQETWQFSNLPHALSRWG
jgi:hypothetical protein